MTIKEMEEQLSCVNKRIAESLEEAKKVRELISAYQQNQIGYTEYMHLLRSFFEKQAKMLVENEKNMMAYINLCSEEMQRVKRKAAQSNRKKQAKEENPRQKKLRLTKQNVHSAWKFLLRADGEFANALRDAQELPRQKIPLRKYKTMTGYDPKRRDS